MAALVDINSRRVVGIYTRCGNQLDKSKLVLYEPLFHCNNHFSYVKRQSASVLKVGVINVDVRVSSHLKEELA